MNEVVKDYSGAGQRQKLKKESSVIDSPESFPLAVGRAQLEGISHIEVTEDLFKFITKGQPTEYVDYGSPSVRIYVEGTREEIEKRLDLPMEKKLMGDRK